MRLIDADAVKFEVEYGYDNHGVLLVPYRDIKKSMESTKTVDAVPVVRCKDCKHCDPENYHCDHAMGTAAPLRRKPDDFCSYGERRGGEEDG